MRVFISLQEDGTLGQHLSGEMDAVGVCVFFRGFIRRVQCQASSEFRRRHTGVCGGQGCTVQLVQVNSCTW